MSHVPAVPEPAHVSRVPRTLLDRVAQWWRTSTLTLEGEAVLPSDEAVFGYEHLCGSLLSLRDLDEAVVSEDAESDDDDSRYCDDDLLAVALEEEFTLQYLLIDGVEGVVLWELVM